MSSLARYRGITHVVAAVLGVLALSTVGATVGAGSAAASQGADAGASVGVGDTDGKAKAKAKAKAKKKSSKNKKQGTGGGTGTSAGTLKSKTGRVTIDGKAIDVVATTCLDYGANGMSFRGNAVSDPGVLVTLAAGAKPEMAEMSVRDDTADTFYRAGEIYTTLGATIPQTTIQNGTARGTATLANVNAQAGDTVEGSFEFRC